MDSTLARSLPHDLGEFYPGHNKWNYEYSLSTFQPDLITELWYPTHQDSIMLKKNGYILTESGFWVSENSIQKFTADFFYINPTPKDR